MRTTFIESLTDAAAADDRIFLVIGDLGFGVVEPFAQRFPDRFVNAGVSEQSMMGIAAGLADSGYLPFVYSIANFPTLRCLEQVRNDVCYHDLPVTIVAVGGGVSYGALGYTHFAVEDIGIMRCLPGLRTVIPCDPTETASLLAMLISDPRPSYLRLGKSGEPILGRDRPHSMIRFGWPREIGGSGGKVALLASGPIAAECLTAADALAEQGVLSTVWSVHSLPVAPEWWDEALPAAELIVTVEEHSRVGGLGSAVLESLSDADRCMRVLRLGFEDTRLKAIGSQDYLRRAHGLDSTAIHRRITSAIASSTARNKPSAEEYQ
ncbi:MAG: transketolase C-terminal domain-containing protein [Acidimicrobiia bacterium]